MQGCQSVPSTRIVIDSAEERAEGGRCVRATKANALLTAYRVRWRRRGRGRAIGQAVTLHFKTTAIKVPEIEKSTVSKSADADGD